jgi:DNA repair protein RadC
VRHDDDRVGAPREVYRRFELRLRDLRQEEFHILLLSTQNAVIRELMVTRGILDASVVHPREVFAPALTEAAAAVILVHNHPSGDPTPSPADREVTRQLVEAGRILGIPVRDHVIIGNGRYASFLDLGYISALER